MEFISDLIVEATAAASIDTGIEGVENKKETYGEITVETVKITSEIASLKLNKQKGTYITVTLSEDYGDAYKIISEKLSELVESICAEKEKTILICGLGNESLTPDALGPLVVKKIFVTRHLKNFLPHYFDPRKMQVIAAVTPGVLLSTGMESAEIIKGVADTLHPDVVIVIDALAARSIKRLGNTVQMADTGLSPGGGVGNKRAEISKEYLGIPVISIGIPTVADAAAVTADVMGIINGAGGDFDKYSHIKSELENRELNMIVTPKQINELVDSMSKLLADSINRALNPEMSYEEIEEFTG